MNPCMTMRIGAVACTLLVWGMVFSQPSGESRAKAEAAFQEIFGKDLDKAKAGSGKAKLDFARTLAKAADGIEKDLALKTVIRDKAISLAASTPTGLSFAAEQYPLVMATNEDRASRIVPYTQLLEKMLPQETGASKSKLIVRLLAAYRDSVRLNLGKEEVSLQPVFDKSKRLIRTHSLGTQPESKDLALEMERLEKEFEKKRSLSKELTKLRAAHGKNPSDPNAASALAAWLLRERQTADAAGVLNALPDGPLRKLGELLADGKAGNDILSAAYRSAASVARTDAKYYLEKSLECQQAYFVGVPRDRRSAALRTQGEILTQLLALEQGATSPKLAEDQYAFLAESVESCEREGKYPDANAFLEKAKDLVRKSFKLADQKDLLPALEAVGKELERRAGLSRQLDAILQQLKAAPGDGNLNQAAGVILLQLERMDYAKGHLLKAESKELRRLGEILGDSGKHAEKAKLLQEAGKDKNPFLAGLARREYESALAQDPKLPGADKLRLLIGQLPAPPVSIAEELLKPANRQILVLFDEAIPEFLNLPGGKGTAKFGLNFSDAFSGRTSFRVAAAPQWFPLEKTRFVVRENPMRGEQRYFRFACKKKTGGIHVGFRISETDWAVSDGIGHVKETIKGLATDLHGSDWEVMTWDLFKITGESTVTGIVVNPLDSDVLLDHLILSPTLDGLNCYKRKPAR